MSRKKYLKNLFKGIDFVREHTIILKHTKIINLIC